MQQVLNQKYNNVILPVISEKILEMNVDDEKDILELIDLLRYNEVINCNDYGDCPVNNIAHKVVGIVPYISDKIDEDGYLYVDGTTSQLYGSNQVIVVNSKLGNTKRREVVAHLLAVYLLDYLKNFNGDHSQVYIATYNKNNMNNKAQFFSEELLTPTAAFKTQYDVAQNKYDNDLYTKFYLSIYFGVGLNFVDNRVDETIFGLSLPLEKTNPEHTNTGKIIILSDYKKSKR